MTDTPTLHWRTSLDNYEPTRSEAVGFGLEIDSPTTRIQAVVLIDPEIPEPEKALYLLDDGKNVKPYYVAAWKNTPGAHSRVHEVILHPFPVSDGSVRPDGRPVDFSTWMLGPRKTYHLKITHINEGA